MGDVLSNDPASPQIDSAKVKQAVDAAFEPASGMTAAFVVTWRGRLIGERYASLIAALYDGSKEAAISTEMTFEDGRKGAISARVAVRDMPAEGAAMGKAA